MVFLPEAQSLLQHIDFSSNAMGKLPAANKTLMDSTLMGIVIKDCRPLSLVDGEGFIEFVKAAEPR